MNEQAQWKTTMKSKMAHMARALYFVEDADLGIIDSFYLSAARVKGSYNRNAKQNEHMKCYIFELSPMFVL